MFSDRLVIGNDLRELRRMSEWLRTACIANGFGSHLLDTLDLCANELVTNIISYAYEDGGAHEIVVELDETGDGARLTVYDDGRPFNILEAPAHEQPASLDQARIGGLGIHLVRRISSGCRYRREHGRNVVAVDLPRQPSPHHA